MEALDVLLDKPELFDRAVHGDDKYPALPNGANLAIITKDNAMVSGAAAAVVTWTVEIEGKIRRVQYTISIRHLHALGAILRGAYDDSGFRRTS